MKILLGADPELFIRRKDKVRVFEPAFGKIPGTKEEPVPLPSGGAVQLDGMAAEFNIKPATTPKAFARNIAKAIKDIKKLYVPEDMELLAVPVATFNKKVLDSMPEHVKELGCNPDFNAWEKGSVNPRPDAADVNFRTGAGHVHIGWTKDAKIDSKQHIEDCCAIVAMLDVTLGSLSTYTWDKKGAKRRQLYGNAGAMRIKPYGVEYRVLSNAWVMDSKLAEIVAKIVTFTVKACLGSEHCAEWAVIKEHFWYSVIVSSGAKMLIKDQKGWDARYLRGCHERFLKDVLTDEEREFIANWTP